MALRDLSVTDGQRRAGADPRLSIKHAPSIIDATR